MTTIPKTLLPLALAALLAAESRAQEAPTPSGAEEIQRLRDEVRRLREQLQEMQDRLAAAGIPPASAPVRTETEAGAAPPLDAAQGVAPVARRQNLLNPAISAVFQAIGNTSLEDRDEANGFDLSEAELAFQSDVDPYTRVDLFLSFPADESPEVEEGFLTTRSLPGPLQLKGGRFKNAFGKWNGYHTHQFFTVERPDALTNFFGEESLTTDGLSLSVLVPNPWGLYIDSITEVGTAREGATFNSDRRALTAVEHLSAFFNTSPDSTLEVGLTAAAGKTGPSEALRQEIEDAGLTGVLEPADRLESRVQGLDVTFKWKPVQFNVYRSFLWQTELLRSRRRVEKLEATALSPDTVSSLGGYSYLEYQFAKRWRAGLRADLSGFPDAPRDRVFSGSALIRFQPSEFQEIRLQLKRVSRNAFAAERFGDDEDDTRLFFEWIPVIGAHGAHKY
jgi:hypothetical protein